MTMKKRAGGQKSPSCWRESGPVPSGFPGLPQGDPGFLKAPCVHFPTAPNQESAALCFCTFSLALWVLSCRELGGYFSSVETTAPCQDKSFQREQRRTSWCRGTGLSRSLPREVHPFLIWYPVLCLQHLLFSTDTRRLVPAVTARTVQWGTQISISSFLPSTPYLLKTPFLYKVPLYFSGTLPFNRYRFYHHNIASYSLKHL